MTANCGKMKLEVLALVQEHFLILWGGKMDIIKKISVDFKITSALNLVFICIFHELAEVFLYKVL